MKWSIAGHPRTIVRIPTSVINIPTTMVLAVTLRGRWNLPGAQMAKVIAGTVPTQKAAISDAAWAGVGLPAAANSTGVRVMHGSSGVRRPRAHDLCEGRARASLADKKDGTPLPRKRDRPVKVATPCAMTSAPMVTDRTWPIDGNISTIEAWSIPRTRPTARYPSKRAVWYAQRAGARIRLTLPRVAQASGPHMAIQCHDEKKLSDDSVTHCARSTVVGTPGWW